MKLEWYTTLVEDAKEEAREAGRKAGIQAGRKAGIQEGIIKTAKNLLKNGVAIDVVERATSLPRGKIMELARSK